MKNHNTRAKTLNSGSVLNTGNWLHYTMMSLFAALGRITHCRAALRPFCPLSIYAAHGRTMQLWAALRPTYDIQNISGVQCIYPFVDEHGHIYRFINKVQPLNYDKKISINTVQKQPISTFTRVKNNPSVYSLWMTPNQILLIFIKFFFFIFHV